MASSGGLVLLLWLGLRSCVEESCGGGGRGGSGQDGPTAVGVVIGRGAHAGRSGGHDPMREGRSRGQEHQDSHEGKGGEEAQGVGHLFAQRHRHFFQFKVEFGNNVVTCPCN